MVFQSCLDLDNYFCDYIFYLLDNHFSFIQLKQNNMAHLNECLLLNIKKTQQCHI